MPNLQPLWHRPKAKATDRSLNLESIKFCLIQTNKTTCVVRHHTLQVMLLCMLCNSLTVWIVVCLLFVLFSIRRHQERRAILTPILTDFSVRVTAAPAIIFSKNLSPDCGQPEVSYCCCGVQNQTFKIGKTQTSYCQNSLLCHKNICSLQLFMQQKMCIFPPFCISCCFYSYLPWRCFLSLLNHMERDPERPWCHEY